MSIRSILAWLVKKEKWTDRSRGPRFYATEECDSCKLCYDECPTGHIKWIDNKPEWEKPCLMCASCAYVCPLGAIKYGVPPGKTTLPDKKDAPEKTDSP